MPKVAIVTGATGIVGSAIIEQLLKTKNDEWSKVIAVSRRKPTLSVDDSRFVFLPIDLEIEESEIATKVFIQATRAHMTKLREGGAADTTHLFFTAYIHDKNWNASNMYNKNVPIFTKFIKAIDSIASGLERIELQTGGKYYGIHLGWNGKLIEDDSPRYTPEPNKPDFYFGQEDFLQEFQKGKKWKYTIYRPLTITGITRGNGMSFGVTLAIYFTIQKYLGRKALYPGNEVNYKGIFEFSNAEVIAKFAIWTSLNPAAENEGFLIIDHNSKKVTGEEFWKASASYFGVEVEEPTFAKTAGLPKGNGHFQLEWSLAEYMKDKKKVWNEIAQKYGIDENTFDYATWEFADAEFAFTWPQHFAIPKAKKLGWNGEQDPLVGLTQTYDHMKHWNMIPKSL